MKPSQQRLFPTSFRTRLAAGLAVALVALPGLAEAAGHDNFLKTSGRLIKNQRGTGDAIYLRGVNLGGWEVHEKWMSPLAGVDDDYHMRKTLSQRFGDSGRDALIAAYQDTYLQEKDFRILSDLGMSAVRLPIYYLNHMNEDGSWKLDPKGKPDLRRVEWVVKMAKKYRMYVILDLHGAPGSQNGADHSGKIGGSGELWGNSTYQSQTMTFWRALAERFKNESTVAGYDLLNEPSTNYPSPATREVLDMYDRIYKEIRAVDPNHIIFMEGIWDWNAMVPPSQYGWTNVSYSFHYYNWGNDNNYDSQAAYTDAKVADEAAHASWGVPHHVGEFNLFALQTSWEYALKRYNEAGWHWTSWTYKGTNVGNWALYNHSNAGSATPNVATDSYETIESKWRSWDVENNMVANTMLNTVFKNSMTGSNSLIRNLPYEGTWPAADKLKAQNYYHQSGVSFSSKGIGFFDGGDWIRYTSIDFGSKGMDRMKIHLAVDATFAGKTIEVRVGSTNGTLIGSLVVPSTGGWDTYQKVSLPITLTKGVQEVYLVGKGGAGIANVDWISFGQSK